MATHYDTLGVASSATTQEIRKAYLRRARALHPDRQVGRPTVDARKAEQAMQQVNVAWDVLSDPSKKAEYDKSMKPRQANTAKPRTTQPSTARPQPSRPQPQRSSHTSSSAARPSAARSGASRSIDESPGDGSVSVLASLPVLLIVGLLLGVLIVVAFADNREPDVPDPIPENANLDVGDCFIFVGDRPRERSCATGTADGRVVEVGPEPGNCPQDTQSMKDPSSDFFLCWARMIPGSTNTVGSG